MTGFWRFSRLEKEWSVDKTQEGRWFDTHELLNSEKNYNVARFDPLEHRGITLNRRFYERQIRFRLGNGAPSLWQVTGR